MTFTVDITPLLVAAIYALVPILMTFLASLAWKEVRPYAVRYLGEKAAADMQARLDRVLSAAIGFAVQDAAAAVSAHGGITFETRNLMVDTAVRYASDHAPDLMRDVGAVTEKVLARFDTHPAVQGLVPVNDNAVAPLQLAGAAA